MTADNKEDEYQFPNQEEYSVADTTGSERASSEAKSDVDVDSVVSSAQSEGLLYRLSQHPFMHNKRLIALLALALVVVVVVAVMRRTQSVAQQSNARVAASAVVSQSQSAPQHQRVDLTVFSNKIDSNAKSIQQISNEMKQVNMALQNVQSQQSQMSDVETALKNNVIKLNTQVKKILTVKSKKKKSRKIVYYIKAMVPGRAWLVSSFGLTDSVGKGEFIKDYGKVLSVDVNDGIVYTSSGRKIVYGQRDH